MLDRSKAAKRISHPDVTHKQLYSNISSVIDELDQQSGNMYRVYAQGFKACARLAPSKPTGSKLLPLGLGKPPQITARLPYASPLPAVVGPGR